MKHLNAAAFGEYLLTLADFLDGRSMGESMARLNYAKRMRDQDAITGIEAALKYLEEGGVTIDRIKVQEHIQRQVQSRIMLGGPVVGSNEQPRIRIALRFEAPWMKQTQELNLEVGLSDILRAFAPLPRNHDTMPSIHEMVEMRRKKEERTKYTSQLSNELMRALRRMVESGDPIKGLYPENSIHEPKA